MASKCPIEMVEALKVEGHKRNRGRPNKCLVEILYGDMLFLVHLVLSLLIKL